jgi:hypothetical protein
LVISCTSWLPCAPLALPLAGLLPVDFAGIFREAMKRVTVTRRRGPMERYREEPAGSGRERVSRAAE